MTIDLICNAKWFDYNDIEVRHLTYSKAKQIVFYKQNVCIYYLILNCEDYFLIFNFYKMKKRNVFDFIWQKENKIWLIWYNEKNYTQDELHLINEYKKILRIEDESEKWINWFINDWDDFLEWFYEMDKNWSITNYILNWNFINRDLVALWINSKVKSKRYEDILDREKHWLNMEKIASKVYTPLDYVENKHKYKWINFEKVKDLELEMKKLEPRTKEYNKIQKQRFRLLEKITRQIAIKTRQIAIKKENYKLKEIKNDLYYIVENNLSSQ